MPHLINTDNERISITEDQYNFLKEKFGRNVEFTVINVKGELQKFVLDGQNWRQGKVSPVIDWSVFTVLVFECFLLLGPVYPAWLFVAFFIPTGMACRIATDEIIEFVKS